ncbi:MAG: hypothetical protein CSB23_02240 [Deltaproteobacteria bacterium]|nr:MAG: hypothetical protein CSB23_02240 [Deltaproteobacteria bacterium]
MALAYSETPLWQDTSLFFKKTSYEQNLMLFNDHIPVDVKKIEQYDLPGTLATSVVFQTSCIQRILLSKQK